MCGIAGIFDLKTAAAVDGGLVRQMTDAIAHRGPDGEGVHVDGGVGLGHRRLAIIDLAGGQQPMFSADRSIALVYNGEIYNYRELIAELTALGCHFQTRSDTEVVIHAWDKWGEDCVKRFRGMFAFALYDNRRNALFLARDRFGKKPLYYGVVGGRYLLFASELKALLVHPMTERRLDRKAVDSYLAYGYVPDPDTIYAGIKKLPPAHTLLVRRGAPLSSPTRYWRLKFNIRPVDEADAEQALIAELAEATRIRLMSEVPLGAFLSGGVDSSGIVAMMADQIDSAAKTFAIGFGEGGVDELAHARRVAERYKTDHHEETVDADPLGNYRAQAAIFDEPFADSSSVPTLRVCALARRNVTVALSGDAGDEIFAGYRRYRMFAATESWRRRVPNGMRKSLFGALGQIYPKLDWAPQWLRAKTTFQELAGDSAYGYYRTVCRVSDEIRAQIYSASMHAAVAGRHPADLIAAAMEEADVGDSLAKAQYADIMIYLPGDILTKVDRCSMAVSLEVRVPLLDHKLAEWSATLPRALCLDGGEGKAIFKRALEPYVPRENLYRRKQGFATSLAPHFRGAGADRLRQALLGERMLDSGLFDHKALARLIDQHGSGLNDHSNMLWTLLMFEGFLSTTHNPAAKATAREPVLSAAQ